jgi:hypothetical protein
MKNFGDLDALCRVMANIYKAGAGAPGREIFTEGLISELELTKEQADLYASVVLSRNTEGSADRARSAAASVMGRWTGAQSQGTNPSVYVSGTQDTWEFKDDLTYAHRQTSYEGYVAPPSAFSSFSYSRPREHVVEGMWAPPDWLEQSGLTIVIISYAGAATRLTFEWTDPSSFYHSSCKINGFAYART